MWAKLVENDERFLQIHMDNKYEKFKIYNWLQYL